MDAIVMLQKILHKAGEQIPTEAMIYWCWFVSKYPEDFYAAPEGSASAIAKLQEVGLGELDFPTLTQYILNYADLQDALEYLQKGDTGA
jgi:hypothetical protein